MIKISLVDSPLKREYARTIREKVFIEEQGVSKGLEEEGDAQSLQFLAEKEGMPVCTGRYRVKGPFLKIERLATLPSSRGKGVATELMLFMQALGEEEYPLHLQILHAQKNALIFYKKLGWSCIGTPFIEAGIEHILMVRLPKKQDVIKNLLCLQDSKCPQEIKDYLQGK